METLNLGSDLSVQDDTPSLAMDSLDHDVQ